jgi:hypothetical protein
VFFPINHALSPQRPKPQISTIKRKEDIEKAGEVELFMPPKMARLPANRGKELEPKQGDSPAILRWKKRMASDEGKEI